MGSEIILVIIGIVVITISFVVALRARFKYTHPILEVGQTCNISSDCPMGLNCEGSICVIPEGGSCSAYPGHCQSGTRCVNGECQRIGIFNSQPPDQPTTNPLNFTFTDLSTVISTHPGVPPSVFAVPAPTGGSTEGNAGSTGGDAGSTEGNGGNVEPTPIPTHTVSPSPISVPPTSILPVLATSPTPQPLTFIMRLGRVSPPRSSARSSPERGSISSEDIFTSESSSRVVSVSVDSARLKDLKRSPPHQSHSYLYTSASVSSADCTESQQSIIVDSSHSTPSPKRVHPMLPIETMLDRMLHISQSPSLLHQKSDSDLGYSLFGTAPVQQLPLPTLKLTQNPQPFYHSDSTQSYPIPNSPQMVNGPQLSPSSYTYYMGMPVYSKISYPGGTVSGDIIDGFMTRNHLYYYTTDDTSKLVKIDIRTHRRVEVPLLDTYGKVLSLTGAIDVIHNMDRTYTLYAIVDGIVYVGDFEGWDECIRLTPALDEGEVIRATYIRADDYNDEMHMSDINHQIHMYGTHKVEYFPGNKTYIVDGIKYVTANKKSPYVYFFDGCVHAVSGYTKVSKSYVYNFH